MKIADKLKNLLDSYKEKTVVNAIYDFLGDKSLIYDICKIDKSSLFLEGSLDKPKTKFDKHITGSTIVDMCDNIELAYILDYIVESSILDRVIEVCETNTIRAFENRFKKD